MTETAAYVPCRCGCQPLVLTGCGCKVCLLGEIPCHQSLTEILDATGAAEPHYCPKCNSIVLVTSVKRGELWIHVCKRKNHRWWTETKIWSGPKRGDP